MSMVRKVTYSLPDDLVAGIQEAVELGEGPSQSAVVREAVTRYLASARDRRLAAAYADAADDEDFIRDSDSVLAEFESIEDEALNAEESGG